LIVGGGPAGQEGERIGGRGGGFGGVDEEFPSGVGGEVGAFEEKVEAADDGVVEVFLAGGVATDVVGAPLGAEVVAEGGQLADEVLQVLVVGVMAGFGAQDRDDGVGGVVPVGVELLGAVAIEEAVAGEVDRSAGLA
jgi:hypothetical protein